MNIKYTLAITLLFATIASESSFAKGQEHFLVLKEHAERATRGGMGSIQNPPGEGQICNEVDKCPSGPQPGGSTYPQCITITGTGHWFSICKKAKDKDAKCPPVTVHCAIKSVWGTATVHVSCAAIEDSPLPVPPTTTEPYDPRTGC